MGSDTQKEKNLLNARKVMDDYAERNTRELQQQVDVSFRILNSPDNRARIPERLFEQFLPLFTGNVPSNMSGRYITDWVSISGSPRAEVDVVGPDGNVLFTVPPLFNTDIVNYKDNKGASFGDIVNLYLLQKANLGPLAMGTFTRNLCERGQQVIENKVNQPHVDQWNNIFSRYGVKQVGNNNPTDKSNNSSADDEFDYDAM